MFIEQQDFNVILVSQGVNVSVGTWVLHRK